MGLQCLFASVISNNSRNICCSQSGAIRVYSVWHAWVLLSSSGWRGTTLDLSPAGKLSCEHFFSCEMDSPPAIQRTVQARMIQEGRRAFINFREKQDNMETEAVTSHHFGMFVYTMLSYKWCASASYSCSHLRSAGLDAGKGSWDASWLAADSDAVLQYSVGGNTLRDPEAAAALRYRGKSGARPCGPRRRGPTAPVGWAQNAISAADVLLRFGGARTSKSDLIVFDNVIIQRCRLFLLFLGGKDIIIQPHLFNCSNWSQSKWALPFICNGHD